MSNEKQAYTKPTLKVYGNVEELTQQGGGFVNDNPNGNGNTTGSSARLK